MSGGGTTSTNTTQKSDPWSGVQPYLTDLFSQAQGLYNQGSSYAPFSTVAPFSPDTSLGLQLTADRALNGSPVTQAADRNLTNIMNGGSTNPVLSALNGGPADGNGGGQQRLPTANGPADGGNSGLQQAGGLPPSSSIASLLSGPNLASGDNSLTNIKNTNNPAMSLLSQIAGTGPTQSGNAILRNGSQGQYNNAADSLARQGANADPNANPANQYLSSEAATSSINPYLNSMFQAASQPVTDAVNAQFSLAGRTGSTANQNALTQQLGNMASTMYGQNYQNAVQNQQNAANSIQSAYDNSANRNEAYTSLLGNLSAGDISNRLNSASALNNSQLNAYNAKTGAATDYGNIANASANTRANAANSLNNSILSQFGAGTNAASVYGNLYNQQNQQQLQADALAPQLANNDYTDLQNLLSVGGAYDNQAQNQIQDAMNRWNYSQQQPWNLLQNYAGVVNGFSGLGGQSSTTQTQPNNSMPSLIGGGMSLLGSILPFR